METGRIASSTVSDAPDDCPAMQMRAIAGIGNQITVMEGKWKVSQNLRQADKRGVTESLTKTHPALTAFVRQFSNH